MSSLKAKAMIDMCAYALKVTINISDMSIISSSFKASIIQINFELTKLWPKLYCLVFTGVTI